jgi:sulfite exporter TauE/SafE
MIAALLLGLLGSLGHCVGMCTGVLLLLGGRQRPTLLSWLALNLGRVSSYALLGALAGALGAGVTGSMPAGHGHGHAGGAPPWLAPAQGALAVAMAALAAYMALALLGRVRSPELALAGLTRHWSWRMHRLSGRLSVSSGVPARYAAGLLWGMLPCGLVLTALLIAAATGSPARGALTMLAFGLGTFPALFASGWLARRAAAGAQAGRPALARYAAAAVVLLFGAQMAFRGLAAWGLVDHLVVGELMVW